MKIAEIEPQGPGIEGAMTNEDFNIVSITDDSFEGEVLKSPIPVLVVFGSESSGSTYITLRQIKEAAREYAGKIKIGKVEAAENMVTTKEFRIRQIPTVLFFKNGLVTGSVTGTVRKREVRTGIRDLLNE